MQSALPKGGLRAHNFAMVVVFVVAVALAACATQPPVAVGGGRGMQCVDDSAHCIAERKAALNHLVTRSDRHWINDRPTPQAYASGVRLFAFKQKKSQLNCQELASARREADSAASALTGPGAQQLSPAQISRGKMLAIEVARDLSREQNRRCRRG